MRKGRFDGRDFAEHHSGRSGSPHGIFGSNFAYLHCPATGMQKDDEASPSTILAGRGILLKMLITLEPHFYILIIFCIVVHFNIV